MVGPTEAQEAAVARDFLAAIAKLAGAIALERLLRALQAGSAEGALAAVPWAVLGEQMAPTPRLLAALQRGGQAAARELFSAASIRVSFDLPNPFAQHWAEQASAVLVREVTDETRAAVRQLVVRGLAEGRGPDPIARLIRQRIGLTQAGEQAVANYGGFLRDLAARGNLADLSAADRASLARGGLLARQEARLTREGLTPAWRERLEAGYRRTLLRERATAIARTELLAATSEGQHQLWQQAIRQGSLDPAEWSRVWIAAFGERTCPICSALNGARSQVNGWFPGGIERPPAHVMCRCTLSLARREA